MSSRRLDAPPRNSSQAVGSVDASDTSVRETINPYVSSSDKPDSLVRINNLLQELRVHQTGLDAELQEAREKLEAGLTHFNSLYDSFPVGCLTLDRSGTILQANLAAAKMLEVDRADFCGKSIAAYIAAESRSSFDLLLSRAFAGESQEAGELTFIADAAAPLVAHIEALADEKGQRCHLMAINITAHKASSFRRQLLSRLSAAFSSPDYKPLDKRSPEKAFRQVCSDCVELAQFPLAWIGVPAPDRQCLTPIELAGTAKAYFDKLQADHGYRHLSEEDPSHLAYAEQRTVVCNDVTAVSGVHVWRRHALALGLKSAMALPLFRGGKPYGVLGIYSDTTGVFDQEIIRLFEQFASFLNQALEKTYQEERLQLSQEELRQSEERFKILVENLPLKIFLKDANSRYIACNELFANALGVTSGEIYGKSDSDFFPAELASKYKQNDLRIIESGKGVDLHESYVRNGQEQFIHVIKTPFKNSEGEIVGVIGALWDITERKQFEQEQSQHRKRLEDLSHRLIAVQEDERRCLASELHDRASPNLIAIQLTLGNLAANLPRELLETNRAYFDDIYALLEDTTTSIREICTELRPPLLDYAGLPPAVEGYAQQFMRRTGTSVNVTTRANGNRLNKEAESLLFRIVQEAIANCAKHSSAQTIDIELTNEWSHTVLSIRDDGIGFNPEQLGHPGYMPGLGLITMKERAEFAGGKFTITSRPGAGTEICVEFRHPDRRVCRSRRERDLAASSRESRQTADTAQPHDNFLERRAYLSRRQQDLGAEPHGHVQRSDTAGTRVNFVERRVCPSRRKDDFGVSDHAGASAVDATNNIGDFVERRVTMSRRKDDNLKGSLPFPPNATNDRRPN